MHQIPCKYGLAIVCCYMYVLVCACFDVLLPDSPSAGAGQGDGRRGERRGAAAAGGREGGKQAATADLLLAPDVTPREECRNAGVHMHAHSLVCSLLYPQVAGKFIYMYKCRVFPKAP